LGEFSWFTKAAVDHNIITSDVVYCL